MNRRKKIGQLLKAHAKKASAKLAPKNKPKYISKADKPARRRCRRPRAEARLLGDQALSLNTGKVNRNSAPCPGSLLAAICPPWAWTMPWVMYKPRPVPVGLPSFNVQ